MFGKQHNDGIHIAKIVDNTPCEIHTADVGTPCWSVFITSRETYLPAICGRRVRKHGFVGQPSPSSVDRAEGSRYPKKKFEKSFTKN